MSVYRLEDEHQLAELMAARPDLGFADGTLETRLPAASEASSSPQLPAKRKKGKGGDVARDNVAQDIILVESTNRSPQVPQDIVITFPCLPPSELMPNNLRSPHWSVRSRVQKAARREATIEVAAQVYRVLELPAVITPGPFAHCEVEEHFTVPTKKRVDVEGLMGAAKAWLDGIVDAGILSDDGWQCVKKLSGSVRYEKGVSRTEIVIKASVDAG